MITAFSITLVLSALLLFSVQPLFAKLLLPSLGGSPGVWAVALCFYQAALLGGYAYAHLLNKFCTRKSALASHCILVSMAALTLPFGVPPTPDAATVSPQWWLLSTLAAGVGLPFLALAATAPLLLAWFASNPAGRLRDPFTLYAASNAGSLLALLGYPFLIEPALSLPAQAPAWAIGFVIVGVLVLGCGLMTVGNDGGRALRSSPAGNLAKNDISLNHRMRWLILSFVPSGLLVAFTSHLTTDIASAPLLWVLPLALYLGTFILTFRDSPCLSPETLISCQPLAVLASLTTFAGLGGGSAWLIVLIISGLVAFVVTSMVCHRNLFELRPASIYLTDFYLFVSLGGALGGMFSALIAPAIFNALYEYPMFLVLGLACGHWQRRGVCYPRVTLSAIKGPSALLAAIIATSLAMPSSAIKAPFAGLLVLSAMALAGVGMVARKKQPPLLLAYAVAAGLSLFILPSGLSKGDTYRSFFGVHRVLEDDGGRLRLLMHGTTIHGMQRLYQLDGTPIHPPIPAAYYHPESPLARGIHVSRQLASQRQAAFSVGIVGLGAGSLSCYSLASENWRFFEIDPLVVKIARNPSYFTFLDQCRPDADIALGDARLTMRRARDGQFNYLVIDAFSSDAVPVHLLTREAVELYLAKIAPHGLLALHISNRHMDLRGVSLSTALSINGVFGAFVADHSPQGADATASEVLFLSKDERVLEPILNWSNAHPAVAPQVEPWTDGYSNVLSAIWRLYFPK